MNPPVPSPRQFLTSLIDSLTSIPTPPSTTPPAPAGPSAGASNPLKLIPPASRPLLTTLYALYPLTLLPALDLLDRRLATRVVVNPHPQPQTGVETDPSSSPSPPDLNKEPQEKEEEATSASSFYLVRSAQPVHPRRNESSSPGLSYVVRLHAWNCTCAAFAFAAFPREERGSHSHSYVIEPSPSPSQARQEGKEKKPPLSQLSGGSEPEWEFGALSADGTEGSGIAGVPCCKHLLACVLAERWGGLLGGYVDERVVSREEGAGLVADI
ncbi:hypothetical protein F4781DRAFT_400806 [Annulohypoxylon bovei var. microspora]|nr:hypothetical protein F4781DRAFT_400806 [Annulohypoxylon bovei var. microspora]